MFDLTRLRVLAAVAKEGSVTAAAEALHYAQPSVSHHLARLEAEAGVPLVQRAGRGVRLTEAGRLLAERAEEILGHVESVHTELAAHAGLRTGRVRLAAFPSALATLVPAAAAHLAAEHPGIELSLTEAEPPTAMTALRNGEVDVALVFEHRATEPADLRHTTLVPLLEEPLYLVTPADRDWRGPRSKLATYAGERWIAGCTRCRANLVAACAAAGFSPEIRFETDDYVAVQALVAAGLGVSMLSGLALTASRNPDVRIDRIPGKRRRVLVANYGRPPAPLPVQALVKALEATGPTGAWPR
ncbi:LysR family transcriptional regulator [Amycolatopsis nigrescens]|uniref:LysR family transcriptional regulator n=1 Tax=Amycolatopsis nigrescens TaxID=381445 RepID=UPI0003725333|nr:LysR family transcriptional regulator [Amycolatopsis nigrescens]